MTFKLFSPACQRLQHRLLKTEIQTLHQTKTDSSSEGHMSRNSSQQECVYLISFPLKTMNLSAEKLAVRRIDGGTDPELLPGFSDWICRISVASADDVRSDRMIGGGPRHRHMI